MAGLFQRYLIVVVSMAVLAAALLLAAADNRTYVIQNARLYTMSAAGVLDRASVVVVNGKITQVGKTVKVPAGAQIIKADGLEVYPGMINAWGNIGLTEIGSVDVMNDTSDMGNFKPQLLAFSAVHPASEHIPIARVNGITTAVSAPSGGIIAGQPALLHLDGWTADETESPCRTTCTVTFPGDSLRPSGLRGENCHRQGSKDSKNLQIRLFICL